MPSYRMLEAAFLTVDGSNTPRSVKAGETVEFSGEPSIAMMPLDAAAEAAKVAAIRANPTVLHAPPGHHKRLALLARSCGWVPEPREFLNDWLALRS